MRNLLTNRISNPDHVSSTNELIRCLLMTRFSYRIAPLSRVWQHIKLSDVSLGTPPRYSLVADEDGKNPNKQQKSAIVKALFIFYKMEIDETYGYFAYYFTVLYSFQLNTNLFSINNLGYFRLKTMKSLDNLTLSPMCVKSSFSRSRYLPV